MSWPTVNLQDIALQERGAIVSGPFGSNISAKFFVDQGIPVIRGNNLTKGKEKFVDDGFVFLTEGKAAEFPNCVAITDDIVFTAAGSIGQVGIIPGNAHYGRYVISNKQLRVRLDKSKANPNFVYAWLSSPQMVRYLEYMNNGGAVPLLNLGIIRRVPVPLPPLKTQEKVADILSAYDDFIENNRRRIALLEQAARLLYREWFVHLRFPGHEHVEMTDGLPEEWVRGTLCDFYDTTSGGTPSRNKPEYFLGDINWVKTQELNERPIFETQEKITEVAVTNSSAKLLPDHTLLVSIYGNRNIGRTGILAVPGTTNQACVALFPKHRKEDWIYAQLWLQQHREFIVSLSQGAAQTNISQQTLRSLEMVWPSRQYLNLFIDSVMDSFRQIECLCDQNRKLDKARGILLPRLMNGEIVI